MCVFVFAELFSSRQILVPGALHNSSTIEMVDLACRVDVGVIDEIQMISSMDRGWAWTRTVLGLAAEELHICGEARSVAPAPVQPRECNRAQKSGGGTRNCLPARPPRRGS